MYKRMLVPLDGSELAEKVTPYAKELAGRLDLDLVLLHVENPMEHDSTPVHRAYIERMVETMRTQSHSHMKFNREPALKSAARQWQYKVSWQRDSRLRKYFATQTRKSVDLILMATHGRSGISRWEYGSVADKVLHGVSSPIFLVRPH